ncbi:MAG: DUF3226 domain-containing protein [Anaerolineae bacterium]
MLPQPLTALKQLLVEGADASRFFQSFSAALALSSLQIHNFGGNSELPGFLKALALMPGFDEVASLAIIRDAEVDPQAAFQSVCAALRRAGLAAPAQSGIFSSGRLQVGVFILPDSSSAGMLESICLRAVAADPAYACIEPYFACLDRAGVPRPANMEKAQLQVFLASRHRPGLRIGEAAAAGVWPWQSTVFDALRRFLQEAGTP